MTAAIVLVALLSWPTVNVVIVAIALIGGTLGHYVLRPWYRTCGASADERTSELPGDDLRR